MMMMIIIIIMNDKIYVMICPKGLHEHITLAEESVCQISREMQH